MRSLYREDSLTHPQIGQLLGRHQSWVSRRLLLAADAVRAMKLDS